ncbi:MAG: serine/threonine-protein kinase [Nannocystaceae bacterium]|nr:serine/threonine-protein kinase [Nannocystaceae bacterium]
MSLSDAATSAPVASSSEPLEVTLDAGSGQRRRPEVALLSPGAEIGRYRVLHCVGQGAMGSVYAAYDPELDRRVAIKLLYDRSDTTLLAEARALAKLSHPHVVGVHDVGRVGGVPFVAMEFVVGRTLRQWLGPPRSRTLQEVMPRFLDAGRGLAAAHAAGIVHRDFKPENVLVGDDGRVRVGDFGLARPLLDAPISTLDSGRSTLATRPAGTPAYMAPELLLGEPADARSDMFSFCVALWEALHGERPHRGRTMTELVSSVLAAAQAPEGSGIPAHVIAALRRGLDGDPQRRFPDMPALLDALAPARPRRAMWPLFAIGGLAIAGAAVAAGLRDAPASCETAWPAWSPTRARTIAAAIEHVPGAASARVAEESTRVIDGFARALVDARGQTCPLREREPLQAAYADACLEQRRAAAEAILEVLATPDRDVLEAWPSLREELRDPTRCLDPDDARREAPFDSDPDAIARAAPVRAAIARARAQLRAGQRERAQTTLATEIPELDPDALSLRAEVALARGEVLDERGDVEAGRAAYYDAVELATRGGDRRTTAHAWIELAFTEGWLRHDPEAGSLALRLARAEIDALGGDAKLMAHLDARASVVYFANGELDRAHDAAVRATEALRALGMELEAANVAINRVNIDVIATRLEDAELAIDEAERLWRERLPPDHPWLSRIPEARARVAGERGDVARQYALATEALAQRREQQGETDVDTIALTTYCAEAALGADRIEDSRALAESAVAAARASGRADLHSTALMALANALREADELESALARIDEAIVVFDDPPDSPRWFDRYEARAEILRHLHRDAEALVEYERVLEFERRIFGEDHVYVAATLLDIVDCQQALGQLERARTGFAEVLARADRLDGAPPPMQQLLLLQGLAALAPQLGDADTARSLAARAHAFALEHDLDTGAHELDAGTADRE